ncbi:MAG: hypothetical protein AB1345_10765 [Chloroflexota bacterium]
MMLIKNTCLIKMVIAVVILFLSFYQPENSVFAGKESVENSSVRDYSSLNNLLGFINSCGPQEMLCTYQRYNPTVVLVPGLYNTSGYLVIYDRPSINFKWNPTNPLTMGDDRTISAVNVQTWFKLDELKDRTTWGGAWKGKCFGVAWAKWKPQSLCTWCFADYTPIAPWVTSVPINHNYGYSSYQQPMKAANGDRGFEVTVNTYWEVTVKWWAWTMCGKIPCPCGWIKKVNLSSWDPQAQICKKKAVPVRQVISVLVPGRWYGIESP